MHLITGKHNKRLILIIAIVTLYSLADIKVAHADSEFPYEYKIKAAFIYKFIPFTEGWRFQQDAYSDSEKSDQPIIIGIIGENPFGDAFSSLKEKRVMDKNVVIKYYKGLSTYNNKDEIVKVHPKIDELRKCDLLFICSSEQQYINDILTPIRNESILTIADMNDALNQGVTINFLVNTQKVHFEINTASAKRAKLSIRSKLLRLAKKVIDKDQFNEDNK